MRRLLAVSLLAAAVALVVPARAATVAKYPWNVPANVRIVQKDTADNVRTFTTIQAAVGSITDASLANPYVVRVMPGAYNESVVLKEGISLVGSGPDATTIESTTTKASVTATAMDATLTDLRIVQRVPGGMAVLGDGGGFGKTITFRNVVVEAFSVNGAAVVHSDASNLAFYDSKVLTHAGGFAIEISPNDTPSLVFERSVIHATADLYQDWALGIWAPNVAMRDSRVTVVNPAGGWGVIVTRGAGTFVNSEITVTTDADGLGAYGLKSDGGPLAVRSCRIAVAVGAPAGNNAAVVASALALDGSIVQGAELGVWADSAVLDATIRGSTVSGGRAIVKGASGGAFRAAGTTLSGTFDAVAGVDRIVNCQDGDFNPIPNL